MARPGDRRKRWKQSCVIGGLIMLLISGFLLVAGGPAGFALGSMGIFIAWLDFRDAKRGWKIRYDLPPKYYRDIKSSNPTIRRMARECAEEVLKEAKDPNRKKYAFETKREGR